MLFMIKMKLKFELNVVVHVHVLKIVNSCSIRKMLFQLMGNLPYFVS